MHWQQFCQKLSKSAEVRQCYCKNKKGAVFLKHSVVAKYAPCFTNAHRVYFAVVFTDVDRFS